MAKPNHNKITKTKDTIRIAVGLSGGVDSSVAAYLLKEAGYDVVGVHMQCWDYDAKGCTGNVDKNDALKVATKLGIKFQFLDYTKEYNAKVIDYFYSEYSVGRTPNPDILCNREIKFGLFLNWALENGFEYVATGHYARTKKTDTGIELLSGVDLSKDQSYFLYVLGQEELAHAMFPLGEMKKSDVRKLAEEVGLHTSNKPDSVGICFVGEVDIKEFLKQRLSEKPGSVVNKNGEILGSHMGVSFYTIGQRHGFEINKYVGLPLYVIGKNVDKNELIVGFYDDAKRNDFEVSNVHWVNSNPFLSQQEDYKLECLVRIRHLGELYPVEIGYTDNLKTTLSAKLGEPVFGVAPGQHAVFYMDDIVLGGGVIQ